MILTGAPHEIMSDICGKYPPAAQHVKAAAAMVSHGKQEVTEYQAAALATLAHQYDTDGAHILEIGTYYGFSAAVMAMAAPNTKIVSLNTNEAEVLIARRALAKLKNVRVECVASWDYLKEYEGPALDMIFVDGDHKRIALDLPWFDWLRAGGLMVFHDYTPLGAPRHCPPVYDVLNQCTERIGRGFDVLIIDTNRLGMAGWYKNNVHEHLIEYPSEV